MRRIAYPLAAVACLATVPAPLPAQQEDEEDAGGFLVGFLEDNLSGDGRFIKVRGLEGALSASASIEEITVADDDGVWLTISNATLDWNRLALVRGRFSVNELSAEEIVVARKPTTTTTETEAPSAAAQPFSLPELPVSVELGEIRVDRLELGQPVLGRAAELQLAGALSLADGSLDTGLTITRLDRPGDQIGLQAAFSNETREITLDLDVTEDGGGLISTALGLPGAPSLELTAKGSGPLTDFTADIALASDEVDRVTGQVRLRSATEVDDAAPPGIAFSADLGGDMTPFLEPAYQPFFGTDTRLRLSGLNASDGRLAISELDLNSSALRIEGDMALAASGVLERLALQGRITPPSGERVVLPVADPRVELGQAQISALYDSGTAKGWTLSVTAEDVETPQVKLADIRLSGEGTVETEGTRRVSGDLQVALDGLDPSDPALARAVGRRVTLDGLFDLVGDGKLRLNDLVLAGSDFTMRTDTQIDGLNSGFAMDGTVALEAEDLARFSDLAGRDLGGMVEAELTGTGTPLGGSFDFELTASGRDLESGMAELDPLLTGRTEVFVSALRDDTGTRLRSLTVDGAALSAEAQAIVTEPGGLLTLDGTARVKSADLAPFSQLAGMDLGGDARIDLAGSGTLETREFDLQVDAVANDLSTGRADLDPIVAGRTRLSLDARNDKHGLLIRHLRLNGSSASADVAATVTGIEAGAPEVVGRASARIPDLSRFAGLAGQDLQGAVNADLSGSGTITDRVLDIRLNLNARDLATGIAQADALITAPVSLTLDARNDAEGIDIDELDLDTGAVTATAEGALRKTGERLRLRTVLDDLGRITPTVSGPLTLTGDVARTQGGLQGEVRLEGPQSSYALLDGDVTFDGGANVDFDARLDRLERFLPDFPGVITAKGNADRTDGVWTIDTEATGPGGFDAMIAGTYDEASGLADLDTNGALNLGIANTFISPNKIGGTAQFDLALDGKPGLPALSGTVSTSGASLAIPGAGQTLTDIGGTVRLAESRAAIEIGAALRAGGTIRASGPVELTPPFNGQIAVDLNQLILTDNALYESSADGRLVMSGALAGNSAITGQVRIGETNINIAASTGAAGAAPIPDIVHLGEPGQVRSTRRKAGLIQEDTGGGGGGPQIGLNIDILAPNRIFVRGRGLNAELGGAINIGGTVANITPSGQIDLIRGVFDILGRRLSLDKGVIALQGSLKPYIEFVSSTTTEDGEASIQISGPVDLPEIEVTSDPERPPEEALAMLLFGSRFSELSPFVIAQMAASLAQLSGAGGDSTKGLRDSTGAESIDLGTDSGGAGQLGLGGYLGENLYSDVTVNTQGDTELNLNLDVTDNFTVRGSVDNEGETGLGIFFQRDY
ncbi:autotransporter secretion inner membrane protein TamB [Cribrihabitans marinus]|uniref:Autotransporter secretion inner membrane protein TamB n=1 Tax=Cribrihabitans marinus TaxID=1227549 RepID=A0A1H6SNM6_9RHOB|nr:translocation/assembly module TamB domain-containing protein [Cribrihabitans marinus]GGH23072.1 translocation/assembly module TamB [Cribrihabitans marinus]SEI69549.1 autotransporter secretion inner membrane protein TamB [Cribrihabitans marinus]